MSSSAEIPRMTKAWVAVVCFVQKYVPFGTVSLQTRFGEPREMLEWKRDIDFSKPDSFETLNIGPSAMAPDEVAKYNEVLRRLGLLDK